MEKCYAVLVTYNRLALLKESITALELQTRKPDKLILVDNCSTDGTNDYISAYSGSLDIDYVKLPENIGGAGGFYMGMKRAYETGADWMWCMDDDCICSNDALEKLLSGAQEIHDAGVQTIGFVASRVLWTDGTPCLMNLPEAHWMWIKGHAISPRLSMVRGSSFVSMLVSRGAVDRVGYPVKEFFIWFDDAEYSRRITDYLNSYLVTDSIVTHKTPLNLAPLDFKYLDDNSLWKYKYGIKNQASYNYYNSGWFTWFHFGLRIFPKLIRAGKVRFLPYILSAYIQGFLFNYKKYIVRAG